MSGGDHYFFLISSFILNLNVLGCPTRKTSRLTKHKTKYIEIDHRALHFSLTNVHINTLRMTFGFQI